MGNDIVIAVDVAKSVLEVGVSDRPGHVCGRERLSRSQFLPFFLAYPGATVVMEACGSAHYWGRELQGRGHQVVLLPPHHVRPYVRGNKTDRTDTKGHSRGVSQRRDQTGSGEDDRPAVAHHLAPSPFGMDDGAHGTAQCAARPAPRARNLHPPGRPRGDPGGVGSDRRRRLRDPSGTAVGVRRRVPGDPRHRGAHQEGRSPTSRPGRPDPRRGLAAHHTRHRPAHRHRARRLHR